MPAYEYQCGSCAIRFERRQKMSESALETCPECGGRVQRLISGGAGAITKGGSPSTSYAGPKCEMAGNGCGGGGCMNDVACWEQ